MSQLCGRELVFVVGRTTPRRGANVGPRADCSAAAAVTVGTDAREQGIELRYRIESRIDAW